MMIGISARVVKHFYLSVAEDAVLLSHNVIDRQIRKHLGGRKADHHLLILHKSRLSFVHLIHDMTLLIF